MSPTQAPARRRRTDRTATYTNADGREREIAVLPVVDGTLLVDRSPGGEDPRLIARIEADERDTNVELLARMYVADATRGRCRPVADEDTVPAPTERRCDPRWDRPIDVGDGRRALLERVPTETQAAVRWTIAGKIVSLRCVVGAMQDYEPAISVARAAVGEHASSRDVSVCVLTAELDRLLESPVVLNRRLREHVQNAVGEGVSLSELAHRCGRIKRSRTGMASGDTSWLARRCGLLPEAGHDRPTPWVHTDVLALIARAGLGIAPREVEVTVECG